MTEEKDTITIIAGRVLDVPNPVDGARQVKCSHCGFKVWLSPSSPSNYDRILCSHCASDLEVHDDPEAKLLGPNDAQLAELEAHFKKIFH